MDGAAPVSAYFVTAQTDGVASTAMLRGRALDGVTARLPDGMVGVVVSETHFADLSRSGASAGDLSDDSDSTDDGCAGAASGGVGLAEDVPVWSGALQVDASFDSMRVWRHDEASSVAELHHRMSRTTALLRALHAEA